MRHFMFEDCDSGEVFIVYASCLEEAMNEAKIYFSDPVYIYELTEAEAKASELDEY